MKTASGRVTGIKWSSDDGTIIGLLDFQTTFKGFMPGVAVGTDVEIKGKEIVHPKFGPQIDVETYSFTNPNESQQEIMDTLKFLYEELGLQKRGQNIFRVYGANAKKIILANPYQIARDVGRIGFKIADEIATKLGVQDDDPQRIEECVLHCLKQAAEVDGHIFLSRRGLVQRAVDFTAAEDHTIDLAIMRLCEPWKDPWERELPSKVVVEDVEGGGQRCYLRNLYEAEIDAATKLQELKLAAAERDFEDVDKEIEWFERLPREDDPFNYASGGISMSDEQREAVRMALTEKILIITGGPGVGKTTIIKAITKIAKHTNRTATLCAPTGRAAKRMTESTVHAAATIHRTLQYDPRRSCFSIDGENAYLEGDIVICDETSMVDLPLAAALIRGVNPGSRLVFVGDVDQLPPVGPGAFFRDLISSGTVPVVRLNKIYRQKEGSLIIDGSRKILARELPDFARDPAAGGDLFCFQFRNESRAAQQIVELVTVKIPSLFNIPMEEIQIISPMHKGTLGTDNLNLLMQAAIHGRNPSKGEPAFFVDDRVIQNKNNYDVGGMGVSVMNGDIGVVRGVRTTKKGPSLVIKFPSVNGEGRDGECHFSSAELSDLSLGYAITIHKSQGSEQRAVILVASSMGAPPKFYNRNMLYTAFTRGKQLVITMTPWGLEEMDKILKTDEKRRNTLLSARLKLADGIVEPAGV